MPSIEQAGAVLEIDLAAVVANYRRLRQAAGGTGCAAVLKANAYGLGAAEVARALAGAGCGLFFVAHLFEALALRDVVPAAEIYVLHGAPPGTEAACADAGIRPVLSTPAQIAAWPGGPAALHVDTGINRLGFSGGELADLARDGTLGRLDLRLLVSHLACADTPGHPMNRKQLDRFRALRALLPEVPASLANSSGIFLGPEYRFDLVRAGAALYGVNPTPDKPNPMSQVVHLRAKILQIREIDAGESVGYGAAFSATGPLRIAIVPVGYADGYLRALGGRAQAWAEGGPVPVVGRVSMDMITLDVSSQPALKAGDEVELLGDHVPVDTLAAAAGTIGYEILTALGPRYHRRFRPAEPAR